MSTILQDVRYGVRVLGMNRGFALAAILTIGLGVGINTSIFSIADGMLFRPLPYPHADRLIELQEQDARQRTYGTMARGTFEALKASSGAFDGVVFRDAGGGGALVAAGGVMKVFAYAVSPQFLQVLGADPLLGRAFRDEDFRRAGELPVILMPRFWLRIGGDRAIVGTTLRLEERALRVVGVMAPGFIFPTDQGNPQPDYLEPAFDDPAMPAERARIAPPIARLKSDATMAQAQAEAEAVARSVAAQQGKQAANITVRAISLRDSLFFLAQPVLLMLLGAAGFVLLIVCANLASLLLARGTARERELAVRTALGASRARLVRQLMIESLVLAFVGGALGLLIAYWTFDLVYARVPGRVYRMFPAGIDYRVALFAAGASLLAGLIFGALPAIRFSRPDLNESLQQGTRASRFGHASWRIGSVLVAGEVALVVILLAGAGLMVKSFARLRSVDLGLTPDRVDFVSVSLPRARYPRQAAYDFSTGLLQRIRALPQVEAAAGVGGIPLVTTGWSALTLPGVNAGTQSTEPIQRGAVWLVTADYFRTLRIRMVAGRAFTDREGASNAAVAVLSESAARTGWPGGDALGRVFQNPGDQPRQIVGIVSDVKSTVRSGATPIMYVPFDPATFPFMDIAVRSRDDSPVVAAVVKTAVQALDGHVLVTVTPFVDLVESQVAVSRFQTALFSVFAGLGVVLAAVGIFGVVAYMVSRRTHEIGVRMALGADAAAVRAMVVRQSIGPIAGGLALGVGGALWLTRLLESSLFEVTPHDPATLITVVLLLAGTALAATYLPARRASRVDPMVALRAE